MDGQCPIAIIGIGFRGPGGADNPEKLWDMLIDGRSAWSEVPSDRWNEKSFYHPDVYARDANYHRGGHFIRSDLAEFDAGFFGMQDAEANVVDPQQRILLETTYEALENAGLKLEDVRGSDTSVFVASFVRDYEMNIFKDTQSIPLYTMTGTGTAIAANRISYNFDLKGPSFVLDTGCSGSLVALHQACQSLRSGESSMAVVGGTNLILGPDTLQPMSLSRVLNKDGKCYTFDSRGAGYGRGEGVATIVVKRLADAQAAGDPIRAVIRNTGINQDGKTAGITLPNQSAQETLINRTYQSVGLDPKDTFYVEAHGTGTIAGDNIEIAAIANTFVRDRQRELELFVGSVKTNLGHLESTSGLAGLIKAVLIVERGLVPSNINFESPKDGLLLEQRKINIPLAVTPWPGSAKDIRRASVNSFGYGGTNAHVILESAPCTPRRHTNDKEGRSLTHRFTNSHSTVENSTINGPTNGVTFTGTAQSCRTNGYLSVNGDNGVNQLNQLVTANGSEGQSSSRPRLFVLSAKAQKSVYGLAKQMQNWVASHLDEPSLDSLTHTLSTRRSLMPWRASFVATGAADLIAKLNQPNFRTTKESAESKIVLLFTGQGAQWYAMGRELISTHSAFRESLMRSEKVLAGFGAPWSLIEVLSQDQKSTLVSRSDLAQPVSTALQIALVDLLRSLNIQPDAVLGHSSGEIAAAYCVGALPHESAMRVSYRRGFTADAIKSFLKTKGAMLAVGLGEKEVSSYINQITTGTVRVACVNSPSSTTISGDADAIEELQTILGRSAESIFNRKLKVDTAYHSHHMQAVAEPYLVSLTGLHTQNPRPGIKFFSSVTGEQKTSGFGPQYWVDNLLGQVRFSDALQQLCKSQQRASLPITSHFLIEVGPHSALSGPVRQTLTYQNLESFKSLYLPTLVRKENAISTILDLTGRLFESGWAVDLKTANSLSGSYLEEVVTDLAPYSWDHSRTFWSESRLSKEHRLRPFAKHDILGLRIVATSHLEPSWRNILSIESLPWLKDHVVDDMVVFPGAGYMCMALEAVRQINQERQTAAKAIRYKLHDVSFMKALVIPDPGNVEVQFTLRPASDRGTSTWENFKILARSDAGVWSEHCRGSIMTEFEADVDEVEGAREAQMEAASLESDIDNIRRSCNTRMDSGSLYSNLYGNGNIYGETFAAVTELSLGDGQAIGTVCTPDVAACMPSKFMSFDPIHPATLDAVFHIDVALFNQTCGAKGVMPVLLTEVTISADLETNPGNELLVTSVLRSKGPRSAAFDCNVFQGDGQDRKLVISLTQGELRAVGESTDIVAAQAFDGRSCYEINWKPDVDFVSGDFLAQSVGEDDSKQSSKDQMQLLETVASIYIQQCLMSLDQENVVVQHKHHTELLEWMKNYNRSETNQILLASQPNLQDCLEKLSESSAGVELLTAVGSNLFSFLKGESQPLSLMEGDDMLSQFYKSSLCAVQSHSPMAEYLKLASFKHPHMKVLEVGAGTGSATVSLMKALTHEGIQLDKFTFTDSSYATFEKAQSTLEQWSDTIEYKTLDIEKDPISQGFAENSYDIVSASFFLHATSNIHTALKNACRLLKPEGCLILNEITQLTAWTSCAFGLLVGQYENSNDGRTEGPFLSVAQWDAELVRAGFHKMEVSTEILDGRASTMVAKKVLANKSELVENGIQNLKTVQFLTADTVKAFPAYLQFSDNLCSALRQAGIASSVASWQSAQPEASTVYVVLDDGAKPLLTDPSAERFRAITTLLTTSTVLWISAQESLQMLTNPEKGLLVGLERVACAESGSTRFQCIDVQESIADNCSDLIDNVVSLISALHAESPNPEHDLEPEFVYRGGQMLIPRCVQSTKFNTWVQASKEKVQLYPFQQPNGSLKLHVETPGLLDSMIFIKDTAAESPLDPDELELDTKAFGVNLKDVCIALGQMKTSDRMLGECSGLVTRVGANFQEKFKAGDRVCAWYATPFASRARVSGYRAHLLADKLSFAEGASIPIAFMTAYHGLIEVARLRKGQTVLINAASGGVGQAAIQIAKHIGANIFVTVGTAAKKRVLVEQFGIDESHIFSSRLRTFKAGILRLTKGKGVDVVLNCVSGEALAESWSCIGRLGTFVELGKTDVNQNSQMTMSPFGNNVTFTAFDLSVLIEDRPEEVFDLATRVLNMIETGILKPFHSLNCMPITGIEDAFRLIQSRKHTGKVVLEVENATMVKSLLVASPTRLPENSTYVIAGGLGDLGRNISRFLARHGAKHIVALSRRHLDNLEKEALEAELSVLGAELHTVNCDITNMEQVQNAASYCSSSLPPVRAVIQAAMVLKDGVLESMTAKDFATAVKPKVCGTKLLAQAFDGVESFVMFSSITSIIGNRGQGNYAAGCAFQDAFATSSKLSKTHVVSMNLPLIAGSDVDTQNPGRQQSMNRQGIVPITMDELFTMLDYSMSPQCREDGCSQIIAGLHGQGLAHYQEQFGSAKPMFNHLLIAETGTGSSGETYDRTNAHVGLTARLSKDEVYERLNIAIANKISTLVAIDYADVHLDVPILNFGLDSLVAIELKNWITRTFKTTTLDTSEILGMSGIKELASLTAERSSLVNIRTEPSLVEVSDGMKEAVDNPAQEKCSIVTLGPPPTGIFNGTNEALTDPARKEPPIVIQEVVTYHSQRCCTDTIQPPALPLLGLETMVEYYLANSRNLWTKEEYESALKSVNELMDPKSVGHELHNRLLAKKESANVANWMLDVGTKVAYLEQRHSLLQSNIGGSHKLLRHGITHSQSQRAALIALAAFKFKQEYESCHVAPNFLGDTSLCLQGHESPFNSCRRPGIKSDVNIQFPRSDFIVVMYRGHIFKVDLLVNAQIIAYVTLKATFTAILNAVKEYSWVTLLTTIERDHWAKVYSVLSTDPTSTATLNVIESSAFIICLDDAAPMTAGERIDAFLLGSGFNRWYDKGLEFIVCSNGISGFLGEQSKLDVTTMNTLNASILREVQVLDTQYSTDAASSIGIRLEEHTFIISNEVDEAISFARLNFFKNIATVQYKRLDYPDLGSNFLKSHSLPPRHAWEVIIQLATRMFFGYNPAAWQAVSMDHYHQARTDTIQVATRHVIEFCMSTSLPGSLLYGTSPKLRQEQRSCFFKAVEAHTNAITRAQAGKIYDSTFTALRAVRKPDEIEPSLFISGAWSKTRPKYIVTGLNMNSFEEVGILPKETEGTWLSFDVGVDGATFSVVNAGGKAEEFCGCIKDAAMIVKEFLIDVSPGMGGDIF